MRIGAAGLAVLLLGGCATTGVAGLGGGGSSVRMIVTEPAGALLTIEGAGECETPCTVRLDKPQRARLAKAGFVATTVTLNPGRGDIVIPLELAAPSVGIDTTALPELD